MLNLNEKVSLRLNNLKNVIKESFNSTSSSKDTMHKIAQALQLFGRQGVHEILVEILKNSDTLESIAKNSYLHQNGFYKIILLDEESYTLRLHIWLNGIDVKETLHDHRWYLASAIINGSLKSEIWENSVSDNTKSYDEYMYIGKEQQPLYLGKAKVTYVNTVTRVAGECYTLDPNVLHRIVSSDDVMSATLMCRSALVKNSSRNIIVNDKVPNVIPTYLSTTELEEVLRRYLELSKTETDKIIQENAQ